MGIAQDKLNAYGEEPICELIRDGKTQDEIAADIGISAGALNNWLHANGERSARARAAMSLSAETWLDRGLKALIQAEPEASEIARARAIEQHCARRAAIRDPKRYGDKIETTHEVGDSIQKIARTLVKPSSNQ
jgi:transcriptional regulator with XRE-family HTH domain